VSDIGLHVYIIDSSTGILTMVATENFTSPLLLSVITSPFADLVYVSGTGNGNQIFAANVNTATGALLPVAGSPFLIGGQSVAMAIDPTGQFLYTANSSTNQIEGFAIATNGALSPIGGSPFADATGPVDIAIDATSQFVVTANTTSGTVASFSIGGTGALIPSDTFVIGSAPSSIALVKKR
jgi:6-phosphogluconolactonase (cycloisomerase 2 family)